MDTLYNDMCDTLSCQSCDLTLIALFYFKNKLFMFLSTAKTKNNEKKNSEKENGFFTSLYLTNLAAPNSFYDLFGLSKTTTI